MIYREFIVSKTGSQIAVFSDGTLSASKYNPEREADTFGNEVKEDTGYFIIGGIAGGIHIKSLVQKFPEAFFLCVEENEEAIDFCLTNTVVKELSLRKNILFCTVENISTCFTGTYIPALYNSFAFLPLRTWKDKISSYNSLTESIEESLKIISADYSVQCHFGKIWQRNILENLKFLSENKNSCSFTVSKKDLSKTAAVIAAGPSLDSSIKDLKEKRNLYFIFATDTTYGSLIKQNIIPDAVISIDGQLVSATHFYNCKKGSQFVFDLCSNPSAVKKVFKSGRNVYFVNTGHPLALLASQLDSFISVNSGSGTVTIAACDFALKCGFSKIKFFGSDFCYNNGKPYAKGTYLDINFYSSAKKTSPAENSFINLMYRTETKTFSPENFTYNKMNNSFTTEILDSYRNTLKQWLIDNKAEFDNGIFFLKNTSSSKKMDYKSFVFTEYIELILNKTACLNSASDVSELNFLLPYFAYKKSKISSKCNLCLNDLLKLENTYFKRYTY